MNRTSRNALDQLTRNIRASKNMVSFDPSMLVFNYDGAGTTLTYQYDSSAGTLTESWSTGQSTVLVSGIAPNCFAFSMFDRSLVPTSDPSPYMGKVISVAWNCSRTILGNRSTSEPIQQAQIVMRCKP
jgi:hypothetical protein